jgi:hypothetical protein
VVLLSFLKPAFVRVVMGYADFALNVAYFAGALRESACMKKS